MRPRVAASVVEPDESARPLLLAIGHAVVAVAGLEKALQLELTRLLCERHIRDHDASLSTLDQSYRDYTQTDGGTVAQRAPKS